MTTATGHTKAICASRVGGTSVHDKSGEQIGVVEDVVLDKTSNRIMFALVRIGGVVTTADSYYPLPWAMLDFDEETGGYVVPCTRAKIADGPSYSKASDLVENDGTGPRDAAYRYHNVAQDW